MDLLGDKNQDMTLEQALKFVKAKEAGKWSASRLLLPQATDAVAGSSYRRQKKPSAGAPSSKDQDTCTYCGTKGHGKDPPTRVRRAECPAFGTKCSHCGRDHHFEQEKNRHKINEKHRTGRCHIRHTMPGHVNGQHQARHPGPPCLQSSHKGMAKETVQTSTICQAKDEHREGGLQPLWVFP